MSGSALFKALLKFCRAEKHQSMNAKVATFFANSLTAAKYFHPMDFARKVSLNWAKLTNYSKKTTSMHSVNLFILLGKKNSFSWNYSNLIEGPYFMVRESLKGIMIIINIRRDNSINGEKTTYIIRKSWRNEILIIKNDSRRTAWQARGIKLLTIRILEQLTHHLSIHSCWSSGCSIADNNVLPSWPAYRIDIISRRIKS